MFTVVERHPITQELGEAAERWLGKHRLSAELDETWLELVCEDGEEFTPEKLMLHLAAPPADVAPGDSVDVGRTQAVGEAWPRPGAPPSEVPRLLTLARTLRRGKGGWVAACELPGPVRELFAVEDPEAALRVMNATRRTLARGLLGLSGDPRAGRLTFTMVDAHMVARAGVEGEVSEEFACWLDSGPAIQLAQPFEEASRVIGGLGEQGELIITSDRQVQARCFAEDEPHVPAPVEPDAGGPRLRVDRPGGLGRDALAAIAKQRPNQVTITATADGALVISGGDDEFMLEGAGIESTHPGMPLAIPYMVALALHDGAGGGLVELALDAGAGSGRLHRADLDMTLEWR